MKNTAIAIAMMTLILIGTTLAQPQRRIAGSTAMGGGAGVGIKNRRTTNLGDTATHEVGHKGKRHNGQFRPNPTGDGTTQHFRKSNTSGQSNRTRASQPKPMKLGDIKGEVINSQQPNAAKYDGIDGESNDARTKSPNSGVSPAGIAISTEVAAKDIRKQSNKRRNGQFRPNPTGDGTTQQFRKTNTNGQNNRLRNPQTTDSYLKIEGIDGEGLKRPQANGIKFEGIDGESNDARTKQPNGQRNINVNRPTSGDNNEFNTSQKKPWVGGSDDGQSIRDKNPRKRGTQNR